MWNGSSPLRDMEVSSMYHSMSPPLVPPGVIFPPVLSLDRVAVAMKRDDLD